MEGDGREKRELRGPQFNELILTFRTLFCLFFPFFLILVCNSQQGYVVLSNLYRAVLNKSCINENG